MAGWRATPPSSMMQQNLSEPRRSHATIISTIGRYIGRILTQLEELKLTENTLVTFMSGNGHSEADYYTGS